MRRTWLALAVVLVPAAAAGAPPEHLFAGLDAIAENVPDAPHRAGGARLTAGVEHRRVRIYAVTEGALPLGSTSERQLRFSFLGLMGGGVAWSPLPRTWLHGEALSGGYMVELRDYLKGGWLQDGTMPFGVRLGLSLDPARSGRNLEVSPVIHVALAALWSHRFHDPVRDVSFGGFLPMLTVSVGAKAWLPLRAPALPPPAQPPVSR